MRKQGRSPEAPRAAARAFTPVSIAPAGQHSHRVWRDPPRKQTARGAQCRKCTRVRLRHGAADRLSDSPAPSPRAHDPASHLDQAATLHPPGRSPLRGLAAGGLRRAGTGAMRRELPPPSWDPAARYRRPCTSCMKHTGERKNERDPSARRAEAGGGRPAGRAAEGGCRLHNRCRPASHGQRLASPPAGDPPPRRPARWPPRSPGLPLPAASPRGALAALPFPAPPGFPSPRYLSQLHAVRLPACLGFLLSSPLPSRPRGESGGWGGNLTRGRYKDQTILTRERLDFKVLIVTFPYIHSTQQPKSFRMGKDLSCAWLTQTGERARSRHELPERSKKKVFWVPRLPLY